MNDAYLGAYSIQILPSLGWLEPQGKYCYAMLADARIKVDGFWSDTHAHQSSVSPGCLLCWPRHPKTRALQKRRYSLLEPDLRQDTL